jgi:hypothetical protein
VARSFLTVLGLACPLALAAGDARADVTSWLAVGGGATTQLAQGAATRDVAGQFDLSFGFGSSPKAPFVVGLLYRMGTIVDFGTDLGAAVRLTTGGFARGDWGLALDAGLAWRTWGQGTYGDSPFQGVLTLGAPWGLQLALGSQFLSLDHGVPAQGFFAALEIDLLRLTVMRQGSTERWWPNPAPAGGHDRPVSLLTF